MKTVKHTMIIHAADEGGLWAEFPALPGCTTQGKTVVKIHEHAHEPVDLYLENWDEGADLPTGTIAIETVETQVGAGE